MRLGTNKFPANVIALVSKAKALVQESDKLDNAKRRCLVDGNDSCDSNMGELMGIDGGDSCDGNNGDEATTSGGPKPPQLAPGFNISWDSYDAQRLFNSSKERETVGDRLEELIAMLVPAPTRWHCHTTQLSRVMRMQTTQ
jgi:hypothetical protein